jgi:hypothetical protein
MAQFCTERRVPKQAKLPTTNTHLSRHRIRALDDDLGRTFRSERQQARFLCVSITTLRSWRQREIGPPWTKIGRAVLYKKTSTDRYLASREVNPREAR